MYYSIFTKAIIAYLLSSAQDVAVVKIIVSIVLIISIIQNQKTPFSPGIYSVSVILLLILGSTNSILYMTTGEIPMESYHTQLMRVRFHFIEFMFAVILYQYFRTKSKQYIIDVLFIGIGFNILAGIIQLYFNKSGRISMLFYEPSAAGMYYIFIVSAIYHSRSILTIFQKRMFYLFGMIGLFIFSKAQYIALIILAIQQTKGKTRAYSAILMILSIYVLSVLQPELFHSIMNFTNVFYSYGMKGLNAMNGIYNTWASRISAFYVSIQLILEHPLGIGFGSFNVMYADYMRNHGLSDYIWSGEIISNSYGEYFFTPKSILMEIFVSTGLIGIFIYMRIFLLLFSNRKTLQHLYYAFISLTLMGLIVELAPFFAYMGVLVAMFEKEKKDYRINVSSL